MKKYNIKLNENDGLEYMAYVQDDTQNVLLRYANNSPWVEAIRGKKAALLKNNGNGIDILMKNKVINLDYSEFVTLKHLIDLHLANSQKAYGSYKYEEICICKCGRCKK